jgi:hypothetical protein
VPPVELSIRHALNLNSDFLTRQILASAAAKAKGTYFRGKFYRLKARRGIQARGGGGGSWWPSITCFPIESATTNWAISIWTSSTNFAPSALYVRGVGIAGISRFRSGPSTVGFADLLVSPAALLGWEQRPSLMPAARAIRSPAAHGAPELPVRGIRSTSTYRSMYS